MLAPRADRADKVEQRCVLGPLQNSSLRLTLVLWPVITWTA